MVEALLTALGESAVKYPLVELEKDGELLGAGLVPHLEKIEYIDCIDNEVDGLTLSFSKMFLPPEKGDKLKAWIGFGSTLDYIGEFYVTGWMERPHAAKLEVYLTPVDFSKKIKEKRTTSYDNMTLTKLLEEISKRHELKVVNDLDKVFYKHKAQTNESDLAFMKRLADEQNATFAIKNGTIIFKPKSLKKDKDLPKAVIDMAEISNLEITHQDKTEYNSGEAKYHCTKKAGLVTVTVGEEEAKLTIEGSYKDEAEARAAIIAELERENAGQVRGSFDATTQELAAGVLLQLIMGEKSEDDLQITEVRHTIDYNGYIKRVSFTK